MDRIETFKTFLRENNKSDATVKNYISDLRRFVKWFENHFQRSFDPGFITPVIFESYYTKLEEELGRSSSKRHLSTLQQFFHYLTKTDQITSNPITDLHNSEGKEQEDDFEMKAFRFFLINQKASDLTIKNYTSDLKQFFAWLTQVLDYQDRLNDKKQLLSSINKNVLNTYKERLLTEKDLSPVSINRKLTSLRRYIDFLSKSNLIDQENAKVSSLSLDEPHDSDMTEATYRHHLATQNPGDLNQESLVSPFIYSSFPPVRLAQKIALGLSGVNQAVLVHPLADLLLVCQNFIWKLSGERIFHSYTRTQAQLPTQLDSFVVSNFEKSFYAPLDMSLGSLPVWKRVYILLRYARPNWYKRYHKMAFVHYVHLGILLAVTTLMGMTLYQRLYPSPESQVLGNTIMLGQNTMRYQGVLLDNDNNPITTTTPLRFAIYDDKVASGASLLWEDTQTVSPDREGNFALELGNNTPLPLDIIRSGISLYLGIAVKNTSELAPRQPIPNVHLAQDAERVGGLLPITDEEAGSKNVLLALDSVGNLTIGDKSSTIFQATGGTFTIKGQSVILSTLRGSNGSITLSPDGFGSIDLHKPLQNTSDFGTLLTTQGAVEVADAFAVLATTSGQSAFTLNQNGSGPLISASSSGVARFTVDNTGSGYFASNLTLDGTDLATNQNAINIFNRKASIINLGGEAIAITIGSQSGTTTIRTPTTSLYGNLEIGGKTGTTYTAEEAGITFSGAGSHTLKAGSGTLVMGSEVQIGKDLAILPQTADGNNDLGSALKPFDTLYINKIVSPGSFGIGTSDPLFRLHVEDTRSATATAMITNLDTGATSGVLALKLGTIPAATNSFVTFLRGNGETVGRIDGNGAFVGSGSDFAEYFKKHDPEEVFAAGNLVCLHTEGGVTKCTPDQPSIVGVISDRPSFVGGGSHEKDPTYVLVGIQGQIPVMASSENGPIEPSDHLTYSSTPGVAAKAISPSQVVGQALEGQNQTNKIMTYIKASWYNPHPPPISRQGDLQISLQRLPEDAPSGFSSYLLTDNLTHQTITALGAFSDAVIGTLAVGFVKATEFTAEQATITRSLFAKAIQAETLTSPLASIDRLAVNVISPLSSKDGLSLVFTKKKIELVNENNIPVASFDNLGNASFSGSISSSNLRVSDDATVSGTLRVKKLIADEIEGLPESTTSATYVTNVTNVYQATSSASPTPQPKADETALAQADDHPTDDTPASSSFLSQNLITDSADSRSNASFSAFLTDATLTAEFATITKGFMSFGPASFADISTSGQLAISGNMILSEGSINVLGKDLELQPLRQGNVTFMAGLVKIDIDGNLSVKGNASFEKNVSIKGTLSTNIIAPVPEEDLIIQLGEKKTDAKRASSFVIHDASGSAKFRVNDIGDLIASGSGSFVKLMTENLNLVRGAQADTSVTETIASSSAGTATINRGQRERTILSPFVTERSLIYLTPTSNTEGTTPYIARQTAGEDEGTKPSFTIQITRPLTKDVNVNWWIIN